MKLDMNMQTAQYIEESDDDDDSTSGSNIIEHIPYRDRPEWADVEPKSIKTQTGILNIKYSLRYEEAFSYFRAMMARDELSERSLELTADCISLQKSNFSVWYFRRRILKKLAHHMTSELDFVENAIECEPKNYQVWHHRKTIVEWLKDGSLEKQLTASVLSMDNKNYHAWQHRQWAIKEFDLWPGELDFTDNQLALDVRNNSAWNHRFYVVKETLLFEDTDWVDKEITRVLETIEKLPNNESSWSYLRGLLMLTFNALTTHIGANDFCQTLYSQKNCREPHLLSFMLDMMQEELTSSVNENKSEIDISHLKSKVDELCKFLVENDTVRSRYWKYYAWKIEDMIA